MRVFVDANILVSVLNKEYPLFTYASRILSLGDLPQFEVFTSPVCLAIAFYFAEKKYKAVIAKQKIALLSRHLQIGDTTRYCVEQTVDNVAINDFEDGLQYYTALGSGCTCIITEDIHDFYFAKIAVLNSRDFFLKYLSAK